MRRLRLVLIAVGGSCDLARLRYSSPAVPPGRKGAARRTRRDSLVRRAHRFPLDLQAFVLANWPVRRRDLGSHDLAATGFIRAHPSNNAGGPHAGHDCGRRCYLPRRGRAKLGDKR